MANPLAFDDVANLVLDCVCTTMDGLTDTLSDEGIRYSCPCARYVSPGAPAFLHCCDKCEGPLGGQLTVHVANVFESTVFPERGSFIHPCAPSAYVLDLVVTTVRCAPTLKDSGKDPTPEQYAAAARIGHVDLWAMMVGLQCCTTTEPSPGRTKRRVSISNMRPVGEPSGGCMGYEVAAFVDIGPQCQCEPVGS